VNKGLTKQRARRRSKAPQRDHSLIYIALITHWKLVTPNENSSPRYVAAVELNFFSVLMMFFLGLLALLKICWRPQALSSLLICLRIKPYAFQYNLVVFGTFHRFLLFISLLPPDERWYKSHGEVACKKCAAIQKNIFVVSVVDCLLVLASLTKGGLFSVLGRLSKQEKDLRFMV
jgi:hypothetical protein